MKNFRSLFSDSAREMRKLSTITSCALLAALSVILAYFKIRVSQSFEISFEDIPSILIACLYGPVTAPIVGAAQDVLNYLASPNGAFFPGFTLTAVVSALIWGVGLYHKPVTFRRTVIVTLICAMVCGVCMNTLWLYMMYGRSVLLAVPLRILRCAVIAVVNAVIVCYLVKALRRAGLVQGVPAAEEARTEEAPAEIPAEKPLAEEIRPAAAAESAPGGAAGTDPGDAAEPGPGETGEPKA